MPMKILTALRVRVNTHGMLLKHKRSGRLHAHQNPDHRSDPGQCDPDDRVRADCPAVRRGHVFCNRRDHGTEAERVGTGNKERKHKQRCMPDRYIRRGGKGGTCALPSFLSVRNRHRGSDACENDAVTGVRLTSRVPVPSGCPAEIRCPAEAGIRRGSCLLPADNR